MEGIKKVMKKVNVRGRDMDIDDGDVELVQSALRKIEDTEKSQDPEKGVPELTGREHEVLLRYWRQRFNK